MMLNPDDIQDIPLAIRLFDTDDRVKKPRSPDPEDQDVSWRRIYAHPKEARIEDYQQ